MVMAEKIAHAAINKILIYLECPNEVNKEKKVREKPHKFIATFIFFQQDVQRVNT
jgi:hypothetical protein